MKSLQNTENIKKAVEICNDPDVKEKIFYIPRGKYHVEWEKWEQTLNEKAIDVIKESDLPEDIKQQVVGMVEPIALRILSWARYHKDVFDLSYDYSTKFLNDTFFTPNGIINSEKVVKEIGEKLVNDETLPVNTRYKLACVYCLEQHIPALWKQITKKEDFYDAENPNKIKQPELVKFWSYNLMGEIDKLKGEKSIRQYRFDKALENGNEVAVRYCWQKLNLSEKGKVVDFAMQVLKHKAESKDEHIPLYILSISNSRSEWFPVEYYNDILCFLLSEMKEEQKREFFKRDIEVKNQSRVLNCFLEWPYQDLFMETVGSMWEVLPKANYANLLLEISDKFLGKDDKRKNDYDYRELFRKLWQQSPSDYKRYVFSDRPYANIKVNEGKKLLVKLFNSAKLTTNMDGENIELVELILKDATPKEKENIVFSDEGRRICLRAIEYEKFQLADLFIELNGLSKEKTLQFKKELIFSDDVRLIYKKLVSENKLELIDKLIKWCLSSEEEIKNFKKELIFSNGVGVYKDLILKNQLKVVDEFIKWGLSSEEEIKHFKKQLVDERGGSTCYYLICNNRWQRIEEFLTWVFSSKEEINDFKKKLAYKTGSSICRDIILDNKIHDDQRRYTTISRVINFVIGKWEQVEMFLTWAFSSEEEISEFKKKELLKTSGVAIHSELIWANKWEEAETFFAWLGLFEEEIKELKKESIFGDEMFNELMFSEEGDERFLKYGGKQEAITLFLRWCLVDKEITLEFQKYFKWQYEVCGEIDEELKAVFRDFDLAIEERLSDLAEEEKKVKRKAETSEEVPNKKLCSVEPNQQVSSQHL